MPITHTQGYINPSDAQLIALEAFYTGYLCNPEDKPILTLVLRNINSIRCIVNKHVLTVR